MKLAVYSLKIILLGHDTSYQEFKGVSRSYRFILKYKSKLQKNICHMVLSNTFGKYKKYCMCFNECGIYTVINTSRRNVLYI